MNKLKKILIALGAVGTITVSVAVGVPNEKKPKLDKCKSTEINLDYKANQDGHPTERVCVSEADYNAIKGGLWVEFSNKDKDYDFDIKNREILTAVLNRELSIKSFSIQGNVTKDKIRDALIELLNN